jgi:hypothetical protein
MIKRFASAALVAGLVTVGAASASSLGDFDSPTLASSLVEVSGCNGDDAAISFTTSQAADQSLQPATAYLKTMTVSGLGGDCEGATLEGQLVRDDNGKDKMMGYFTGGAIVDGEATVTFADNSRKVEDVEKILLIARD